MKKQIIIEGMSCSHCVKHVQEALTDLGGKNVDVNLDKKAAVANFSENVKDEEIILAIEDAGYDVVAVHEL